MHSSPFLSVNSKRGSATLLAIIFLSVLVTLAGALTTNLMRAYSLRGKDCLQAKAFHIAEGGLHKALWELSRSSESYAGEKETSLGEGAFTIEILPLEGKRHKRIVTSTGYTSHPSSPRVTLKALVRLKASKSGKSSVVLEHWELLK